MGRDIGEELFRPLTREVKDLNVRLGGMPDLVQGLKRKKKDDRDGVTETDNADMDLPDGNRGRGDNGNNGNNGESTPQTPGQHQAKVESGEVPEPNWHKLTTSHHGPPPADMDAAHGHHIVFKKGLGARQQAELAKAKEILERHGINWYTGSENLIWAPNVAGQHTITNVREVLKRLQEADAQGADAVIEALRRAGRELFGGKP